MNKDLFKTKPINLKAITKQNTDANQTEMKQTECVTRKSIDVRMKDK